jgi:glucose dehydrogenase
MRIPIPFAILLVPVALGACDRDRGARTAGDGWLGYNGSPDGQRYVRLDRINAGNVAGLKPGRA